jgi:hypothetical protein
MGVFATADRCLSGIFGLFFKLMIFLVLFAFAIVGVVMVFAYWPFTISMIIGWVLSLPFYRRINKKMNLGLPDYFFTTLTDVFSIVYEGDEEIKVMREDMDDKLKQARKETQDMHNAVLSLQEEYDKIRKKRNLKSIFSEDPYDVSPRMIMALEMELGQPKWVECIKKASQEENGDWEKYRA